MYFSVITRLIDRILLKELPDGQVITIVNESFNIRN